MCRRCKGDGCEQRESSQRAGEVGGSTWHLPTEDPISTEGPSGPREAPLPRVSAAATVLAGGRSTCCSFPALPSRDFTSGLPAGGASNPPTAALRTLTSAPAAHGACQWPHTQAFRKPPHDQAHRLARHQRLHPRRRPSEMWDESNRGAAHQNQLRPYLLQGRLPQVQREACPELACG